MILQLRELFRARQLISRFVIPLLAYFLLGYAQSYVYDWTRIQNVGFQKAIEIIAFFVILILLYLFFSPLLWIRPSLKIKIYREGSSRKRPETSAVLSLASREQVADVSVLLEFSPSAWTRVLISILDRGNLGIGFSWKPDGLLSCSVNRPGDVPYCVITDDGVRLLPFQRMDLREPNDLEYSFRFALGTTQVVQRTLLRPRYLDWRSRILFGLTCETAFLFEIKEHE